MKNLYQQVTDKILSELQNGALPWVKPWKSIPADARIPHNAITKRPYSGVNVVVLWSLAQAYPTARFLTFKQATEAGGHVRKGEKATPVYYVGKLISKDTDDTGEETEKTIAFLKEYYVFNVTQCEGLPHHVMNFEAVPARNNDERDEITDAFTKATLADIREGFGEAFYRPTGDFISMPAFLSFSNADSFYATLFHELGHWTGAEQRLHREFGKRFGDQRYAAEELVAELCAAFLCAEFGFDGQLRHAGYIDNWIKLLKHDNKAFFTAASRAQAAADYMRQLALIERNQPQEGPPLKLSA